MFNRVLLHDPSLKSTSAQNKSCTSYYPLQLLFWPNFKLLYEIWSFSGSNWSQNHSIESTVRAPAFSLFCPYRDRRPSTPASSSTRRSSRRSSASGRRPYPLASTGTFSSLPALLLPHACVVQSSSGRRRSSRRPNLATPPQFVAPGAAQTRRPPTPHLPERGRALPRPKSSRRPPLAIVVPAELRPSPLSHSSGHPPPQIDPR